MSTITKRLHSASGTVALVVALLALMASAAGVGYAAGQIGTNDIANNAVTAKKIKKNAVTTKKIKNNAVKTSKIKNGTITAADLVPNETQNLASLGNGGQGDCAFTDGSTVIQGLSRPTFRKDRFGVVHLSGLVVGADAPGGDGVCDFSDPGEAADAIAFMLPAGYIPAKTQIVPSGDDLLLVVGAQGFVGPGGGITLPPGAVADNSPLDGGITLVLDGVSFEAAGSSVVISKMKASGHQKGSLIG